MKFGLVGLIAGLFLSGSALADEIVVGANIGNVPWEFADRGGELVGFEIDLAREVARRLGHTVEVVNIPFNGLFPAVQSGRVDVALSSMTVTEKRLASVGFVQPYYDSAQSLTVHAHRPGPPCRDGRVLACAVMRRHFRVQGDDSRA
jgi:polar amino acid transport system substrate-binding protein